MPKLSVDRALSKAKSHITKGELDNARALYQAILDAFPANERAKQGLQQLGGASASVGAPLQSEMAELIDLYKQGHLARTIERAQTLVGHYPDVLALWNLLGAAYLGLGQLADAEVSFSRSVALDRDYAPAHNNLGVVYLQQQNFKAAATAFSTAIGAKPDYAEAYNNMGTALHGQDQMQPALAAYAKAVALKPDYAEAHRNIGNMMQQRGRTGDAITAYVKALTISPDYDEAYSNLANALSGRVVMDYQPDLAAILGRLLTDKAYARPVDIAEAAVSLVKLNPDMADILAQETTERSPQQLSSIVAQLCAVPLLLDLMHVVPIPDLDIENTLIGIRSDLATHIHDITDSPAMLAFQEALACQCFVNEYVYEATQKDQNNRALVAASVKDILMQNEQPRPALIACLASFAPLHDYEWHTQLLLPDSLKTLEKRQITDFHSEIHIRAETAALADIKDRVSRQVKAQYEDNPYPRWINSGRRFTPITIGDLISEHQLRLHDQNVTKITAPQILIAGCGTGQQSINAATSLKNCSVRAIDLSFSSLAYAKRQTDELGITNIDYLQADILNLGTLDQKFDVIESVGVLHHMDNPMAGWQVITDCLKPGGLMKIGLYSDNARQSVVAARQLIEDSQTSASHADMIALRTAIKRGAHADISQVTEWFDFYSTSELRDLLFHVQEHRFTIPQIRTSLSGLGLVFCGFEGVRRRQHFVSEYDGPADIYDLEKWHDFETQHPNCFADMYQFWCQKPII